MSLAADKAIGDGRCFSWRRQAVRGAPKRKNQIRAGRGWCRAGGAASRAMKVAGARLGSATVELAVTLPVLVLLVFGAIALCRDIYARESLYIAAYETARAAAKRGGTEAAAREVGRRLLESRGYTDAQISILPRPVDVIPPGTEIRVRIALGRWNPITWWKGAAKAPAAEVSFVKE